MSKEESAEVGCVCVRKGVSGSERLNEDDESVLRCEEEVEEDEDEEEDVDFNPFLRGPVSPEASSSLSSEVEGVDGEVDDVSGMNGGGLLVVDREAEVCAAVDSDRGEEEIVLLHTDASPEDVSDHELGNIDSGIEHVEEKEVTEGQPSGKVDTMTSTIDVDEEGEDAICRRTRARYSLASFTLDELETFLQETDDDDDFQNVDDEEEYRKFLTAVLQGREGDDQLTKENENAADEEEEDEENDADFELELEELLDSDLDENTRNKSTVYEGAGRRPMTRQNRKSSTHSKKNIGQTKRSLRPLLPNLPHGPVSTFYTRDMRAASHGEASGSLSSTIDDRFKSGFTASQIGQLHHLIYEHVQLVIQVFTMCIFDSSRKHIASQVQKLICEMLQKRNEVLAWKNVPYPNICFYPSVRTEAPQSRLIQSTVPSPLTSDTPAASDPTNNQILVSSSVFPFWVPSISGPMLSVLDVAPLSLIGRYMDDIDTAVQQNQQRYREAVSDVSLEKEPLFPLPNFPLRDQANCEGVSGMGSLAVDGCPRSHSQPPKKSLAATIVESAKKQSVALVPKEVANLAQRFYPLFNPALYPHKPPPEAVAKRVLFTDAEDELLALGLMEYNTDWKAIQQRFLPCKTKHQIYVRQKNRCSSKAPDNSIKAVRRMKTSPLTAEEILCIQEGLKAYKYDLTAVWKFVLPYRDPSLLPRQWRTALGTQKSYKLDEAKKQKRRLYELKRREIKKADMPRWQSSFEKEDCRAEKSGADNNSADGPMDNAGETYVHEAFLADWRPGTSSEERNPHSGIYGRKEGPYMQTGNMHQFLSASKSPQNPSSHMTGVGQYASNSSKMNNPMSTPSTSGSQVSYPTYQARRTTGTNLVRLAPDLPPVNLPPSVRIVSQFAFKGYIRGITSHANGAGDDFDATKDNAVSQLPQVGRSGTFNPVAARQNKIQFSKESGSKLHQEDSNIIKEKCAEEGGDTASDLQMHPLLFQPPEDGHLPYYPLNCSNNTSSSYSFLSGNQPQLHLTLLHDPQQENQVDGLVNTSKKSNMIPRGIDFHPLMQRTENKNSVGVITSSAATRAVSSGVQHPPKTIQTVVPEATGTIPTPDERGIELDLDFNLSSTSRKEKTLRSRKVNQHNLVESRTANGTETTMIGQSADSSLVNHAEISSASRSMFVSDSNTPVIPSVDMSRYDPDEMGDQSQPDIEMEQEELSDSAEESEENVEFECEEMADSEGEEDGSACEHIPEMQNKDFASFTKKRPATAERDNNIHIHRIPSLELGLSNQGMDDASNSSWLSLDTYSADHEDSMTSFATKNLPSPHPVKSFKKVGLRTRSSSQKQVQDMPRQLSLDLPALPTAKKPRKRVCRPNLNIALTLENTTSDN